MRSPGSIPSSMAREAGETASTRPGMSGARSTRRWESGLTATGLMANNGPRVTGEGPNAERRRREPSQRRQQVNKSSMLAGFSWRWGTFGHETGYTDTLSHEPGEPPLAHSHMGNQPKPAQPCGELPPSEMARTTGCQDSNDSPALAAAVRKG